MEDEKKQEPSKTPADQPEGQKKLPKIDIRVNEFGEIVKDYDLEQLNRFLDENTDDKKLNGG